MSAFEITVAGLDDVRLMAEWAADEGWNPGLNDRLAFISADPRGFLMGRVDGVPAACLSVVRYGTDHGFLGFYIAREPFRGKGFGIRIWQAGITRMGARNLGLDGVVDQQANYRRSGFAAAWRNVRFSGVPADFAVPSGVRLVDARSVLKLVQEQGFEAQFETARMYTGPVPALDFDGYFAVTTLELG